VAIVVAIAVLAAAGYWWLNGPPGQYKADNGGLFPINVGGKFGFMDRKGKTVIMPQFDEVGGFSEGLSTVRVGTKSGYINTKGVVVITPQFDDALQFRYGRAAVKLCCGRWAKQSGNDRFGFVDKDGKFISSPDFAWVGQFSGDFAPAKTTAGALGFVDRSGKLVLSGKFETLQVGFTEGLAPAGSGGKWGYIDAAGKWVIDPQFEFAAGFADGLAQVLVGRWGFIDSKGKFVINPQYDFAGDFHEGYAIFRTAGEWGFIDTKGRVLGEAMFLADGNFGDGLAPVKTEDGWGFIDRAGKMVISPQFDSAETFQNGLARVTARGKEAYVTTAGAFVVDPFPGTNLRAERARLVAEGAGKASNEVWAPSILRTLNTAEITFASTYNKGFTDGLNRLASPGPGRQPSADRADLVAPWLAGLSEGGSNLVVTRSGYRITYTPGPEGFGRIASYTIIAQPVNFGTSGARNFFTDQSAVVRATRENRPAAFNDPPI